MGEYVHRVHAPCTTGIIAAGRRDGRGGRGSSSRSVFSIASTHAAAPLVRFQSLVASWEARRRKRKNRRPAVVIRILLGPLTSMSCIPRFIETAWVRGASKKLVAWEMCPELALGLQR